MCGGETAKKNQTDVPSNQFVQTENQTTEIENFLNNLNTPSGSVDTGKPLPTLNELFPNNDKDANEFREKKEKIKSKIQDGVDFISDKVNQVAGKVGGIKLPKIRQEEVDEETQTHLKGEFDVYTKHKLELIEEQGHITNEKGRIITKEEQKASFLRKHRRFLKRMQNDKRNFWGTSRYYRLRNHWFSDYDLVISKKIKSIKDKISSTLNQTNDKINVIIDKLKEAIVVSKFDKEKADLLFLRVKHAIKEVTRHKEAAEKTLAEYGTHHKEVLLPEYDTFITQIDTIVENVRRNINGVKTDQFLFSDVIKGLEQQQTLLKEFITCTSEINDVQLLIHKFDTEFAKINESGLLAIESANEVKRKTLQVNDEEVYQELGVVGERVSETDAQVEDIKVKEITRREEERKRKEEEERKRKEASAKRLADAKKTLKTKNKNKKESQGSSATFGFDKSVVKTRGSDYTKSKWSPNSIATESKVKIGEAKFSDEDKAFFADYYLKADAYLKNWYKKKKNPKNQLTAEMFTNAAKRVYQKYGHLSYVVPVELALVQGRLESSLGLSGASAYNNPFNVGEYDTGATSWVKKMTDPEIGIFVYMDLMAHDYLSDKTAGQLLENQGKSFVNESGSRYATAPRYEMELKAMMGQVMLIADGKQTTSLVSGKKGNDEDTTFVKGMLEELGYDTSDLDVAIRLFQSTEMFPELTKEQKKLVGLMNKGDKKSFNKKEDSGVDGKIGTRGNTIGLLYYMTRKGNETKEISVTSAKDLYSKHTGWLGAVNEEALGKELALHAISNPTLVSEVLTSYVNIFNKDDVAYYLSNNLADEDIGKLDDSLRGKLHGYLSAGWTSSSEKSEMLRLIPEVKSSLEATKTTGDNQEGKESKYSIDKSVNWLDDNAHSSWKTAKGQCAKYIRQSLEAGFGLEKNTFAGKTPVPARLFGPFLEGQGFKEVTTTDYVKGDIAVIQGYSGGTSDSMGVPYGHIQMYDGEIWISDFKQRVDFWPGGSYRKNKPSFVIYRWSN